MKVYLVIRKPVLMEDEGKPECVGVFETRKVAEQWLDQHATPTDYFKRSDYSIECLDS